ncbi:hypothetical protein LE190_14200 [Massilia oculi]|uniref:Transmembrane protein n=1 Tax=Massilia hydrophila TaxID=3044279 RepID=A0ABS7YBK0_9BURK|nr:DUF6622 family protein [Massilia oculi]MCA1857069.1 hypothetical protein [Massilia oculi]
MSQILIHTPSYVWAILAFLVLRGVLALRERDITPVRLAIIPVVMLLLALQSVGARYGLGSAAMGAWLAGAVLIGLQRWALGGSRVVAGKAAGTLRVRGSWAPLLMMLAVFAVKYAIAVLQAVQPQLADGAGFALPACGLLGLCNGYFLGQLARDLAAGRALASRAPAPGAACPH